MSVPEWLLQLEKGYLLQDPVEMEIIRSREERQREADEEFRREIGEMETDQEAEEDEDCDDLDLETWQKKELFLASMPYADFLKSRYWRWLSAMLKAAVDWTCEICGERPELLGAGLQVHHLTYRHRGYEWPDHLDDLRVVCTECHEHIHGKTASDEAQ